MKKTLLFTFALLCTVVQGVWAQTPVSTEEDLIEAVKTDGKNIKLSADITLHDPLSITVSVTIDLNSHKLNFEQLMGHANDYSCVFAVTSSGTLTLKNGTIADVANKSTHNSDFNAGAIVNKGKVTMESVTISKCSGLLGGAIRNFSGATLTITSCTFDGNRADSGNVEGSGTGGAIWNAGTLTLTSSTFSNNSSLIGGAIWNSGSMTLSDTKFSSNKSDNQAGVIYNGGDMSITSCTFEDNNSKDAAVLYHAGSSQNASKITGCTFNSNTCYDGAGVIRTAPNAPQLVVEQKSSFNKNVSKYGGAIYCESKIVLDGASMTENETNCDGGAIFVSTAGNITIKNASVFNNNNAGDKGGAICNNGTASSDGSSFSGNQAGENGAAISNNGTFTVSDGTIEKSRCFEKYESSSNSGGAIYNFTGATITLKGVTLSENATDRNGGSALLNKGGNATLTNCIIKNNTKGSQGGAIWTNGKTTISGGSISGNKASVQAGAIFVVNGNVDITDCDISGNEAPDCGAIFNTKDGTVTITGGNISNNNVTKKGCGGIYNHGIFNINNVSITGNTCQDTSGGIYNGGELNINGATIQNNTAKSIGGGIHNDGTLSMQGKVIISDNKQGDQKNDVYLHEGTIINVTGSLASSNIAIEMEKLGVFTSGYKNNNSGTDPSTIFVSDRDVFFVATLSGSEATMGLRPLITVDNDADLRTAVDFDGANIQLANDIKMSNSTLVIGGGKTLTIDLNGKTLDRGLTSRDFDHGGQVITVRKGGTLNLSNGTLTGGYGGNGGGLVNEGGTATLTDVNITGCKADQRGAGISNYGTLTMTGGSVTGNTSNDIKASDSDLVGGGGVYTSSGANTTLTGVTITGNQAKGAGGGGVNNWGTTTIDGCTITGNTSSANGGGVWNGPGTTINMQGKNTVTDNQGDGKVNNVYLRDGVIINVTGALTDSKIGVRMANPGTFTSGYEKNNKDVDPKKYFISDDTNYQVAFKENEAKLIKGMTGIESVDSEQLTVDNSNVWYDLNGRKLNSQPKKGIYINNGKKIVVK